MKKPEAVTKELLYEQINRYISNTDSLAMIDKAYNYAYKLHEHQKRETGEPYFVHIMNVAYTLSLLQCGPQTLCAGILHDTVEDCNISKEEIEKEFDTDIANLVDAVTKIGKLEFNDEREYQAANHRKIMIAMAKDIRAIVIKLADRLHNMRTLYVCSSEKQRRVSTETMEVYVPIADRLGFGEIKDELEDICFYYLHTEQYVELEKLVNEKEITTKSLVNRMIEEVSALLTEHNFEFKISGRNKHLYSIYNKMVSKSKRFDEIYDLYGIRIIVPTELNCYEVLGYIHAAYKPMQGRLKDYIAMPKVNMYQSIHTTIFDREGNIFEIQIRTDDMNRVAENGIAAHWSYKEGLNYSSAREQQEIENKLSWYHDLVTMTGDSETDLEHPTEFMNMIQKDIFEAAIYVMSPKGRVIELPNGSTPIDFAYRIHTEVGHNAIGAIVNGALVPINTELKTGDIVNIRTSKQATGPSEDWLKFVKTATAKNKIRAYLQKKETEERAEVAEKGEKILVDELRKRGFDEKEYMDKVHLEPAYGTFKVNNYDELMYAIATKSVNLIQVIEKLTSVKANNTMDNEALTRMLEERKKNYRSNNAAGVIVSGLDSVKVALAGCCLPVYGDSIVGYITKGEGVKVHREDCPNIANEDKRLVEVYWDEESKHKDYETWIRIDATDRNYLISDIVTVISQYKAALTSIKSEVLPDKVNCYVLIRVKVSNTSTLTLLMANLKKLNSVVSVERIIQ